MASIIDRHHRYGFVHAPRGTARGRACAGALAARRRRGAASVEYVALAGVIGLLIVVAVAALVAAPRRAASASSARCSPGGSPALRAIRCPAAATLWRSRTASRSGSWCGASLPCRRSRGGELPVDFRYCRQPSCAAPGSDPGAHRIAPPGDRVHLGRGPSPLRRPGPDHLLALPPRARLGADRARSPAPREIAAASSIRLNLEDDPALVPLETLPGRDHYGFSPAEEPPWRWRLPSRPAT